MLEEIKEILKIKAPTIFEAFQIGADESTINKLESLVGENMPIDMKDLYRESNGFDDEKFANLFYGFPFISLDKIIYTLGSLEGERDGLSLRYADKGINSSYTHSKKRIPICDDSGTSLICVDLDPTSDGVRGQVIYVDYKMRVALKLHDSVSDMVSQFSDDLTNDSYSLQDDALADGVHWLAPIRQIDPVNWFNSPRWQYVNESLKNR